MRKYLLTIPLILSPWLAFGHGGHGIFDWNSVYHYLGSPIHLAPILFLLSVLLWAVKKRIFTIR